ncbi:3-dehydroquinate synthase [Marinococcus luteus]|uniref:3-dehydroquinate synthase n=1 Tax=Marinococcus luteus TaxID=1122204 RepID=UPI002ACC85F4|nr:3-dehydroquinate synthase [Marinococcus luteus]MDZ5782308.1 3-dehydroquinate synthase [Marinococcus luteus]
METVQIQAEKRSYPVIIGEGLRYQLADVLKETAAGKSRFLLVVDKAVDALYREETESQLARLLPVSTYVMPSGEQSKSVEELSRLWEFAAENEMDRKSVFVALGGGVAGDLTGFAAAGYMRGVDYIQLPTTLLAQDSSVGGKTGINLKAGKNLAGAFHPPLAVIYDTATLHTLPDAEWRSGFAEMIKHAYLDGEAFLQDLKARVQSVEDMKSPEVASWIKRSIEVKARIVEEDEREQGVRAFLNLGHTLGHALEKEMGYGRITHGEGVAAGLWFALAVSNNESAGDWELEKEKAWLESLGYPVDAPGGLSADALVESMKRDKKASYGEIHYVLLEKPGKPLTAKVEENTIRQLLDRHYK